MGVPFDNIRPGDWITPIEYVGPDVSTPYGPHRPNYDFDGVPVQVVQKSYPFIAVQRGNKRLSIDAREFAFTKMDKAYIKAMKRATGTRPNSRMLDGSDEDGETSDSRTLANVCPNCGTPMRQRLMQAGSGLWVYICPNCGWNGGPVEVR